MKVGVGLPATIPNTPRELVLAWARRADEGPFSALGIIDRLLYPNYDPLMALSAVAAVTERIRLMTTILVAPLRKAAVLAKQAATLDVLCNGRLTLGLGIGSREDDFAAAPATFEDRGKRFEAQLREMKQLWSDGSAGPAPVQQGGPPLLIGGRAPVAVRRVAQWADGYISGGAGDPQEVRQIYQNAADAWQETGRSGRPRFVACTYYALGDSERARTYLEDYYGAQFAGYIYPPMPKSASEIEALLDGFAAAGADELIFWPTVADLAQLDQLAEIVG